MKNLLNVLKKLSEKEWKVLEKLTDICPDDIDVIVTDDYDAEYYLTIVVPGGWEDEDGVSPEISPERVLNIARTIAEDGYDISDFEVVEIPEPHMITFYNKKENKTFDVTSEDDGRCYFSYAIQDPECPRALLMEDASSISEAVEKYVDLSTMPV